jgi:hypothetical protein
MQKLRSQVQLAQGKHVCQFDGLSSVGNGSPSQGLTPPSFLARHFVATSNLCSRSSPTTPTKCSTIRFKLAMSWSPLGMRFCFPNGMLGATMTSHCRRCLLHKFHKKFDAIHKRDTSRHLTMHVDVFCCSFNVVHWPFSAQVSAMDTDGCLKPSQVARSLNAKG